jgi:tetratricopeptide (TPR) repeat protein
MSLKRTFQIAGIVGFLAWVAAGRPLPDFPRATADDRVTGSIVARPPGQSPFAVADAASPPAAAAPVAPPVALPSAGAAPQLGVSGPAPTAVPDVDDSALRYFARHGDQRRLDAEMARLRALYPGWQPPKNLLEPEKIGDPALDNMWKLYSAGRYADVRSAIATRMGAEPSWRPPKALTDLLDQGEARLRMTNASDAKQWQTVISLAAQTPDLLTCQNVDLLWRLAEAFAGTQKLQRARDAYTYVLTNCDNPQERLATVQKAMALLGDADLDPLLKFQRGNEFAPVLDDLTRRRVGKAAADPKLTASPEDLARVEALANENTLPGDPLVLGWYYYRHDDAAKALPWFKLSSDRQASPKAAEGYTLTLNALGRLADAEDFGYAWIGKGEDNLTAYLDVVTRLLGVRPPVRIDAPVIRRITEVIARERNAAAAEQLGWYAYNVGQAKTAAHWFQAILEWQAGYEPAAYGLAVTLLRLNDKAGAGQVIRGWQDRSARIGALLKRRQSERDFSVATVAADEPPAAPTAVDPTTDMATGSTSAAARGDAGDGEAGTDDAGYPAGPARGRYGADAGVTAGRATSCQVSIPVQSLSPERALARGWCLMDHNRPVEAAAAFAVAAQSPLPRTRADAAYGETLADLRSEVTDRAAVSAAQAPQSEKRSVEMTIALLAQQATAAYTDGRYAETIILLNERTRYTPETNDLLVLKGFSYMKLGQLADAKRIFTAVAATGFHDGFKGLAAVEALENPAR